MATAGYQAGVEATDAQISYGIEATWGTAPATTFQAIRFMSDTLSDTKTRSRPGEIVNTGEVSGAVTTQEAASGDVNFALSYGTFDDFMAGALNGVWGAKIALAGVAGDITLTNNTSSQATLSSTTTNKFSGITVVGQWIRLLGFTNAANNGFFRVKTITDTTHIVLTTLATTVTETPATTLAQVRFSNLSNGVNFQSFFLQKQFSSALFLNYAGAYCSAMQLSGGIGQFFQGKFSFMAQSELSATADTSTGGVIAAPTQKVMDPVGSVIGVFLNESPIVGLIDSFSITTQNNGAAGEFVVGTSLAAGMVRGILEAKGTVKMFFKDFTYYAKFKSEAQGRVSFILQSTNTVPNAYVLTLPNAVFMNPKINAGGPGQPVYATFDIEGNGPGTIMIDRLAGV